MVREYTSKYPMVLAHFIYFSIHRFVVIVTPRENPEPKWRCHHGHETDTAGNIGAGARCCPLRHARVGRCRFSICRSAYPGRPTSDLARRPTPRCAIGAHVSWWPVGGLTQGRRSQLEELRRGNGWFTHDRQSTLIVQQHQAGGVPRAWGKRQRYSALALVKAVVERCAGCQVVNAMRFIL